MKKLFYFLFLSMLILACSKNQESFQPVDTTDTAEKVTQLLVNVTVNEENRNQDCNGTCNTKAPVARATVVLKANSSNNGNDKQESFVTSTSAGGFASFKEIPALEYSLTVSCEYGENTVNVLVKDKKTTVVDIGY